MRWKTSRDVAQEVAEHEDREALRKRVQKIVDKWSPILGVTIREIRIKKMDRYLGTINEHDGRMWIALKLAQQPTSYLEYVVVHEMIHLRSHGHDKHFYELLDRHLPRWRVRHVGVAGPIPDPEPKAPRKRRRRSKATRKLAPRRAET
jgi:predicted metal-dependent hydrolase